MGYSRSEKTLKDRLLYLNNLQEGKGDKWVLAVGIEPEKFAYKIREALHVASIFKEKYPTLAKAHADFKIEVVDRRTVQAVYRPRQLGLVTGGESGVVTHGLESAEKGPTTLAGQQTALSIIQAWHNAQPSNSPMKFPQASLERDELLKLFEWCNKRTPPWLMFVAEGGAITLSPHTADLDGLGWDPSDD
jgi:hypothetical protein